MTHHAESTLFAVSTRRIEEWVIFEITLSQNFSCIHSKKQTALKRVCRQVT